MGFESLLCRLAQSFDSLKIPYMIIGGQAVMLYGEVRQTLDVDVTLKLSPTDRSFIASLLKKVGLMAARRDAFEILEKSLVLPLVDDESQIPVEFIFSPYGFEDEVIARAEVRMLGEIPVRFISADDLVVYKILAGRPRDLEDVRGILKRSFQNLNLKHIEKNLKEIETAMDRSDLSPQWATLLGEFQRK